MTEEKELCPKCGSSGPFQKITNAKRCQQCGEQWDLDRHPIVSAAARRKAEGPRGYQRPDVSQK